MATMIRSEHLSNLAIRLDPSLILDDLLGDGLADPWQRHVLRSPETRMQICCHRQAGKSTATAALALWTAIHANPALVLIVSRSARQAGELFRKVTAGFDQLGRPIGTVEDRADTLTLVNGSRIVSLPNNPDTIVGFSGPSLVIVDEAARVPDEVFHVISPMLLRSGGRLVELSTPYGQRGHFWRTWERGEWDHIRFRASDNPRLDPAFLTEELRTLGQRWYSQEYECEFVTTEGQVFSAESIAAAFEGGRPALIAGGEL